MEPIDPADESRGATPPSSLPHEEQATGARPSPTRLHVHDATRQMRRITELSDDLQREMRRLLKVNNLDFQAMELLMRDGSLTAGELAQRLGVSPALASVVVDRLEAVGHAHRERDAADRRRVRVQPAESSVREAMGHLMPMIMGTDDVVARLSPEERDVVARFLNDVGDAMNASLTDLRNTPTPPRGRTDARAPRTEDPRD